MPTSVRVAIIVMSVLAGLLLLVAAVNLYALQEFSERIATEQGVSQSDAQRSILLLLAPYIVLGLIFALAAWFVHRRHAWARWLGLSAPTTRTSSGCCWCSRNSRPMNSGMGGRRCAWWSPAPAPAGWPGGVVPVPQGRRPSGPVGVTSGPLQASQ
jgi:hypothetical protein